MLLLMLTPAEAWTAPTNDQIYRGFDRNLMVTSGRVSLDSESADFHLTTNSIATANLITTLRQKFDASLDVIISANLGATQPLRIGVWSPWTGTGYFVAFEPPPNNEIKLERISGGGAGATLLGGTVLSTDVGRYELNSRYRVAFFVDRAAGTILAAVSGPAAEARALLVKSESPALFETVQLSLTASSEAGSGISHVTLRDYTLSLPHERALTSQVDDVVAKGLTILLALLGIVAIVLAGLTSRRGRGLHKRKPVRMGFVSVVVGCAIIYTVVNVALFRLGGHPFDFANEELYAYVATTYGAGHLYFLPDVTSLAGTWGGIPWIEASFPYEPVIAYMFAGIGWLSHILFGGIGLLGSAGSDLGYVIKSVNIVFGLADGVLIYLILRELQAGERWSRLGAAMFIFNPAVWFSMSVWGQTHVFSIFLVLLAILFAQRHAAFWAWLALAAACLTRPQMLAFGLLLGAAFLKKFNWRENLAALSWTLIVTFVALAPLILATSPSLPVDILRYVFYVQEAGGNQASLATVSQSAYSVWPLVTYVFHGASGVYRAYTPSANSLVGPITYQKASQVLTMLAMLVVTTAILFRKRSAIDSGQYIPLVAVGVASFLMLLTGIVATHFLLALPLLLLCRRWMDSVAYCFVAAAWTISTLVPMYGDMGNVISSSAYPLLAPANNPVTRFFVELYAWDRFITVAIVANICVVIWLAFLAYRPVSRARVGAEGAPA
jgi:hypothetical protein